MDLEQAMMQISMYDSVRGERKYKKYVFLWKEKGLAIFHHQESGWVINHFNSGKSVLRNIPTKTIACEYMERLCELVEDWTFTLEEHDAGPDRAEIGSRVRDLQAEIMVIRANR